MNLYEKNLEFLKRNSDALYKVVAEEKPIFDLCIEKVEDQHNYIIEYDNKRCFCHSIYNINREMDEMFKNSDIEIETIVVFGFGNGSIIDYIAEHFNKDISLIIIEPNLLLFREVLKEIDLNSLFNKVKDVRLIINKNEEDATYYAAYSINMNLSGGFSVASVISYNTLFNEYFQSFKKNLISFFQQSHINIRTDRFFKYKWIINHLHNYKVKACPIEKKLQSLEGRTVIIVAAGPSLNKNIHLLKQVGDRALIVAVGSAIKVLDSHGFVPHLRVAIDGGVEEHEIFKNIDTGSAPLLFGNMLYKDILKEYKGPKYRMVIFGDSLNQYIYKKHGWEHFTIATGFSVAAIAVSLMCQLKCKRIVFIGQDLCFTGGDEYAKGSWRNKRPDVNSNKMLYVKTKDMFGNDVYSDKVMLGMRKQIETIISNYTGIEYINASAGGLRIENTVEKSMEEVLGLLDHDDSYVTELRKSLDQYLDDDVNEYADKLINSVASIQEDLDKIDRINMARNERLKKIGKYIDRNLGENKIIMELKQMDAFENDLERIDFYKDVICGFFKDTFDAITLKYFYNGNDNERIINSKYKIHSLRTREIGNYIEFTREQIKEICGFDYEKTT